MLGLTNRLSKAIVALIAIIVLGVFYIAPASIALIYFGETRQLYGLDTGRAIGQSLWLFLVAYAWLGLLGLRGQRRSVRVLAIMLTPFAIAAAALVPLGLLLMLLLFAALLGAA